MDCFRGEGKLASISVRALMDVKGRGTLAAAAVAWVVLGRCFAGYGAKTFMVRVFDFVPQTSDLGTVQYIEVSVGFK